LQLRVTGLEKDKTVEDPGRILQLLLDVLDSLVELKLFVGGACISSQAY
jgi:hypothetical protein